MFLLLRQLERWLHQHVFKVGWLLTHNYETTTILYYTFFLPGVLMYEVVYWLTAGILDVRAERAIQWPQKQEIGELKLEFVKISNKANRYQRAIIGISPLIVGMIIIWFIANNVFDITTFLQIISTGNLTDVAEGFHVLTSKPDFWLWVYISFTISNTMFPHSSKDLQGWWVIGGAVAVIVIALFVIGLGNQLMGVVAVPLTQALSVLEGILLIMIGINLLMTLLLGIVESTIEYITGHSATFKNGKMITMTREELRAQREQELKKSIQARNRQKAVIDTGPPSIYKLAFPIPGAPGQEPVSQVAAAVIGQEEKPSLGGMTRKPAFDLVPDKPKDDEDESVERKSPLIRTPGMAPRPAVNQPDDEDKQPKIALPGRSLQPKLPDNKSDSQDDEKATPAAAMNINRPSSSMPVKSDSSDEDDPRQKSPLSPSGAGRPAFGRLAPKPDDEDVTSPIGRPRPSFSQGNRPSFAPSKPSDDESDEETTTLKPKSPTRPSPFSTGGVSPFSQSKTDSGDDEENDDEEIRPSGIKSPSATSPFRRPSPVQSDDDEEDEDEEESLLSKRLGANRPSPFSRGASPAPKPAFSRSDDEEDDDDDEEVGGLDRLRQGSSRPSAFSGGGISPFQKPKPSGLDDEEDEDDEEESLLSKRLGANRPSPFSRGASPAPKPAFSRSNDDEDEDGEDAEDALDSFFGSLDEDEEIGGLDQLRARTNRPNPFRGSIGKLASNDDLSQDDDD